MLQIRNRKQCPKYMICMWLSNVSEGYIKPLLAQAPFFSYQIQWSPTSFPWYNQLYLRVSVSDYCVSEYWSLTLYKLTGTNSYGYIIMSLLKQQQQWMYIRHFKINPYILETSSKQQTSTDLKTSFQTEVVDWHTPYTHWCSETVQVDSATAKTRLKTQHVQHYVLM